MEPSTAAGITQHEQDSVREANRGGLTIRSSRDRFAAAELFGKLSQRRGRKALRLNSGVRPHEKVLAPNSGSPCWRSHHATRHCSFYRISWRWPRHIPDGKAPVPIHHASVALERRYHHSSIAGHSIRPVPRLWPSCGLVRCKTGSRYLVVAPYHLCWPLFLRPVAKFRLGLKTEA